MSRHSEYPDEARPRVSEHHLNRVAQLDTLFTSIFHTRYAEKLGRGLSILGAANSACLVTTLVLLLCYSLSSHTYNRVRPSLFVSC